MEKDTPDLELTEEKISFFKANFLYIIILVLSSTIIFLFNIFFTLLEQKNTRIDQLQQEKIVIMQSNINDQMETIKAWRKAEYENNEIIKEMRRNQKAE